LDEMDIHKLQDEQPELIYELVWESMC